MAIQIPRTKGSKPYPRLEVMNPGKGLNNLITDSLIDDHEASDLKNIEFVESGCPSKSTGKTAFGTGLNNNPKGLGSFYDDSGHRYMVTIDGTALVSITDTGGAWSTVSGATFTTGKETSFTTGKVTGGNSAVFIWNGTDGGAYWDGTTLSRPGTMPSASFSIFYDGIHVAAGTATNPNRLYMASPYFQDTRAGDVFTTNGAVAGTPYDSAHVPGATVFNSSTAKFVDVVPGDGDKITGLAKFKDTLVVFKERSIYQLTLDSSGNVVITPILNFLGAVSHRSVENVENDIFYLTRKGWYVLGNEPQFFTLIRTNELSARIHPLVDTINPTNLSKVASLYYNYRFLSAYPSGGSTYNNACVTYDRRFQGWSNLNIYNANAFTEFIDTNNKNRLFFVDDNSKQMYEIPAATYNDNGSAIDAYWVSKAFDVGMPEVYKRWIDITLVFRQIVGTITITLYADNNALIGSSTISTGAASGGIGTDLIGQEMLGGNPNPNATTTATTSTVNIPYRKKISQTSRTIKVKVENANNNETFTLLGLILTYRPYSHFKFPSTLKIN